MVHLLKFHKTIWSKLKKEKDQSFKFSSALNLVLTYDI